MKQQKLAFPFLGRREKAGAAAEAQKPLEAPLLIQIYRIGTHVPKLNTITTTISTLGDYSKPYQIFLGAPFTTRFSVADADLDQAARFVAATGARIFVHSQYLINLCANTDWAVSLLKKNLKAANSFGGKGVVVHVGKATDQPMSEALEKMRAGITAALEAATPECPLLLETPAGQGTETLQGMEEFLTFVESFQDDRLRACLDTCHVFACGHCPLKYLEAAVAYGPLLKLVHYNDSKGACGSCVDRHAFIGEGHIGLKRMGAIASFCDANGLPMVIE